MRRYAFFDVDSLELSPTGKTFLCHPNSTSISDKLFETYSLIATIAAPLVFSMDVNRNSPDNDKRRRDFLSVPVNKEEADWKESVTERFKIYLQRTAVGNDKKMNAIFNNNPNTFECIKLIQANQWFVFGNGLEFGVDHVMSSLLGFVRTVRYIPELIVPGETETEDQLDVYFEKWNDLGAIPISYKDIFELARKKPKPLPFS